MPSGMKFEVELERGDKETELELTVVQRSLTLSTMIRNGC